MSETRTSWTGSGPVIRHEQRDEKTCLRGFRPGPTQTGLYNHQRRLEAGNFGFRKKKDFTIYVA